VDAEETDDLGLPLVRGPFRSLGDAKAAIVDARAGAQPTSPLADRIRDRAGAQEETGEEPEVAAKPSSRGADARSDAGEGQAGRSSTRPRRTPTSDEPDKPDDGRSDEPRRKGKAAQPTATAPRESDRQPEPEPEPTWFRDLSPADRGRARRLIERMTASAYPDPVSVVRRDLAGDVPALAAAAIQRRIAELPADAGIPAIVALLADGRDDDLDVRWRIVDGTGRPILIEAPKRRR
jgi:hypothetical protein